jgi:hypothetical protein
MSKGKKEVLFKFNFSALVIFLERDNTLNPELENSLISSRPIPLLVPVIMTFLDMIIQISFD